MLTGCLRRAGLVAAGLLIAGVGSATAAPQANKVFTVGNYPVDARAKDAVTAKAKAHAEGQQAALGALFKRLVPVTAYNRLKELKQIPSDRYAEGVSVRSESNSSTEYIASLDFAFSPDGVRNLLRQQNVPFVDEQAPKAVVIPVVIEGGKVRAAGGTWNQVWKGLDLDYALTPLSLEALDPALPPEAVEAVLSGKQGVETAFAAPYKNPYILLAAAAVDTGAKKLTVTIAGQDAAGPFTWTRTYRLVDGDVAYTMDLAAVVTLGVLEGRWKAAKTDGTATALGMTSGAPITIDVEYASSSEWDDLRGRLLDLPGVDNVAVGSMLANSAGVSLTYPGGAPALATALAQQGVSLTNSSGRWVLRSR